MQEMLLFKYLQMYVVCLKLSLYFICVNALRAVVPNSTVCLLLLHSDM